MRRINGMRAVSFMRLPMKKLGSLTEAAAAINRSISSGRCWPSESRSEEHTSELQSHLNLVCRLLLEKKKSKHQPAHSRNDASTNPGKSHYIAQKEARLDILLRYSNDRPVPSTRHHISKTSHAPADC